MNGNDIINLESINNNDYETVDGKPSKICNEEFPYGYKNDVDPNYELVHIFNKDSGYYYWEARHITGADSYDILLRSKLKKKAHSLDDLKDDDLFNLATENIDFLNGNDVDVVEDQWCLPDVGPNDFVDVEYNHIIQTIVTGKFSTSLWVRFQPTDLDPDDVYLTQQGYPGKLDYNNETSTLYICTKQDTHSRLYEWKKIEGDTTWDCVDAPKYILDGNYLYRYTPLSEVIENTFYPGTPVWNRQTVEIDWDGGARSPGDLQPEGNNYFIYDDGYIYLYVFSSSTWVRFISETSWEGELILPDSPYVSGKTYLINNYLYRYCSDLLAWTRTIVQSNWDPGEVVDPTTEGPELEPEELFIRPDSPANFYGYLYRAPYLYLYVDSNTYSPFLWGGTGSFIYKGYKGWVRVRVEHINIDYHEPTSTGKYLFADETSIVQEDDFVYRFVFDSTNFVKPFVLPEQPNELTDLWICGDILPYLETFRGIWKTNYKIFGKNLICGVTVKESTSILVYDYCLEETGTFNKVLLADAETVTWAPVENIPTGAVIIDPRRFARNVVEQEVWKDTCPCGEPYPPYYYYTIRNEDIVIDW